MNMSLATQNKKKKEKTTKLQSYNKWKEIKLYTVRVTPLICVCILLITSWKEQRIYS